MILIVTKLSDGRAAQGAVRPVYVWAWLHTLRTGDEPENMQQVLEWAGEEMVKANISKEVIEDMITDEINNIIGPKHELEMDPELPEIA